VIAAAELAVSAALDHSTATTWGNEMRMTIAIQGSDGVPQLWEPTTLDQLDKYEADLEAALSRSPALLCLESRRTGIYGPFAVFNQLALGTPLGREIYPDITLLTASGDVVIVEVKRFINPELRERDVIAQAIDYVSSLTALTADDLARLFNGGIHADWGELVRSHFPDDLQPDELADTIRANVRDGNIHIVVACDKAPEGVFELARSVSAQSHLGFSLDVVEVTPFVPKDGPADAIMYVPNVRLSTEIVARTAVTVTYPVDATSPVVNVATTSVEEIEENLAAAQAGTRRSSARIWTDQEVEDAVLASDNPTVHELYRFAKEEGYGGRIQSNSPRVSAAFGFYMHVRRHGGSDDPMQFFNYVDGARKLVVYVKWLPETVPEAVLAEYKSDLKAALGSAFDVDALEPNVLLTAIGDNLEAFKDAVRKLQRRIDPGAAAGS